MLENLEGVAVVTDQPVTRPDPDEPRAILVDRGDDLGGRSADGADPLEMKSIGETRPSRQQEQQQQAPPSGGGFHGINIRCALALIALACFSACATPEPAENSEPEVKVLVAIPLDVKGQEDGADIVGNALAHSIIAGLSGVRDLEATSRLPFHKRKIAMLYDNDLGGDMPYAKALLREIAKLRLWGLGVQFSLECLEDEEFVDLLAAANCRMAFLGMESLHEPSLAAVAKRQNRVAKYRQQFAALRRRGILVFAGTMLALDGDTAEYYERLPGLLEEVDPAAIFLSLAIPIPGTPFHGQVEREGRILDLDPSHYDGDHLVLRPGNVEPVAVLEAAVTVKRHFYSWWNIARRWGRLMRTYLGDRRFLRRLMPALLLSFILWQLSAFQRKHARERAYPLLVEALAVAKGDRRDSSGNIATGQVRSLPGVAQMTP